jgi:multiple sugar transport system permease protein
VVLVLAVWTFPIVWAFLTSLKVRTEIFILPPKLVFWPTIENYVFGLTTRPIPKYLMDSFILAAATTLVALAVSVLAGYALARLRFRLRRQIALFILFMQMIPLLALILPFFVMFTRLNLLDTYLGLVLANLAVLLPTAVWLMITYFEELPREMEEAAAVDGATHWQTFIWIMLPQAAGGAAVTGVFTFTWVWNEFLFAVVLSGSRVRPITVGLYGFLQYEESLWGPMMAAAVMSVVPVVIMTLLAQRRLIRGLTLGAVK